MGERTPQPIRHGVGIEGHQITRVVLSSPEPQLYFIPDLRCVYSLKMIICEKGRPVDFLEMERTTCAVGCSDP